MSTLATLATPAVLVDRARLAANIREMQALCDQSGVELRPHIKTHKMVAVARQRPGAIVTTCSTNGFQPEEDSTAYDVSKGAMVMLTRTLAQSLASHHIRVNGIAPGLIRTPLTAGLNDAAKIRHYEKKILLGRLGEPDDCAGAAVFLLSAAARYITGQILVVDGGLTLGQIGRM